MMPELTDADVRARITRLDRMAGAAAEALSNNPDAWDDASERCRNLFRRVAFAVHEADRLDGE